MIARLTGKVLDQDGEVIVIDVSGVGYQVFASRLALESASTAQAGAANISLVVHTDVKENDISLYGFSSLLEKQVFLLLKKVKGIGSRMAINLLSSMGPEQVLQLIGSGDVSQLQRVPGIGKKTAERIIVELREQVGEIASSVSLGSASGVRIQNKVVSSSQESQVGPVADATLALEKLGFSIERARKAVTEAQEELVREGVQSSASAGELLQLALVRLP